VATDIRITDSSEILFQGLPQVFKGGRYHSWVVDSETLPECLQITAIDENGMIMGITHKQYDVSGLQFHPESVLTEHGKQMLSNWLSIPNNKNAHIPLLPSLGNDHFAKPDVFTGTCC